MMKKLLLILLLSNLLFSKSEFEQIQTAYMHSYNYENIGNYTEAIKVLSPIYSKYPKGYTINLRLGWLFYLSKKYADAIKHYNQASFANQFSIDPKLGLMRIYYDQSNYEKVEILAYDVLKTDYYNFYANLYALKALIAQKKYHLALQIAQKMLYLYPTNIDFLEQLVLIYPHTSPQYLQKLYEDILILDPNNMLVQSLKTNS